MYCILWMLWDKYYYDYTKSKYTLEDFLKRGQKLYGGDDVVAVWPTWPTLGLDQRNQFDLFRDLPGGTAAYEKDGGDEQEKIIQSFLFAIIRGMKAQGRRIILTGLSDL